MITCISLFFAAGSGLCRTVSSAALLLGLILLGIFCTFGVSRLLSHTILKGIPSSFTLELPPYRRPQIGKVLLRSLLDRTVFVLGRACLVAAPAGALLWGFTNCTIAGKSLFDHCAAFLELPGQCIGLDGVILLGFLLGFPANEIVLPIILMGYTAGTTLTETSDLSRIHEILTANGWTPVTALCMLLFLLFHFPCSTTCLTIRKETGSWKWTLAAWCIPTLAGILLCGAVSWTVLFLDASSTAYTLGMKLSGFTELTVITNGINLALELKDIPGVTVILTGGIVTSASASIEGLLGADLLKKIHTDIAFVSARGFSVEDGLTDFSIYEADLKHMCIKASAKTVALVDHTKFDTTSISSYASLDDINMVITDSGISPETADIYEKAGTDIVISGI